MTQLQIPTFENNYHVYSAVSAGKSDLTNFRPPPISMNFFFVENLCTFRHPQVSLLNPLILLYDSHILPWIIYDWKSSAISAPLDYWWIFLRPWGLKLRNKHGICIFCCFHVSSRKCCSKISILMRFLYKKAILNLEANCFSQENSFPKTRLDLYSPF